MKSFLARNWFVASLPVVIAAAWLFPNAASKGGWLRPEATTDVGVALIFLLQGMALPTAALAQGASRWRLHLLVQAFTFVGFPLIGLGLDLLAGRFLTPDLRLGFLFLCVLPSTVSSSVVLTQLAGGNTVVVKPSELTPFSAELFAKLVADAGFPPGVVNILPGNAEAGAALVEHPLVKKVTFTGGPDTAKRILHSCAEQMKPVVLELGGKSANIIFADADLDNAITQGCIFSIALMAGQGCAFPTRMLVQDSIYDEVVERVRQFAEAVEVGGPFSPTTVSGPVVNEAAFHRIIGMIERTPASSLHRIAAP